MPAKSYSEKSREWRKRNPDKIREYKRKYYLKYRDRMAEKSRRYYAENNRALSDLGEEYALRVFRGIFVKRGEM